MTYINPSWFYWINVIEGVGIFLTITFFVLASFLFASFCVFDLDSFTDTERNTFIKRRKILMIAVVISLIGSIFIPTKEVMIQMKIAENVTHENVDIAAETIKDTVDYIFEKLGE